MKRTGYGIREHLPVLAGFKEPADGSGVRSAGDVLRDYRRVRNLMFKDNFYGTVRRLAHERGLRLYSESGGPWNRDPSVFLEADQLAFLGVNDMPQGEFWTVRPRLLPHVVHAWRGGYWRPTLYLGCVAGGLARVLVNGKDCGVAWCYPYRARVPASALAAGRNEVEIQVVNTWRKRLIGDCMLPENERRTKSFMKYGTGPHNTCFNDGGFAPRTAGYSANDSLDSCGLYGPVELH